VGLCPDRRIGAGSFYRYYSVNSRPHLNNAANKGENMKSSTQDRAAGKVHEVKGKIKEQVGKATKDPDLEASGKAEKNAGKVQNWIGRAEKLVGE
jgi:uncharacterized protein YjbJ (UPF0337 family)